MLKGTYVFKVNGREIGRQENLLTDQGKRIIAAYLAGNAPAWAGAIAIGAGDTAATVYDQRLAFEFYRAETKAGAVNFNSAVDTHTIVMKAEVDPAVEGTIYEVGIFPDDVNGSAGMAQSSVLTVGDDTEPWEHMVSSEWVENTVEADPQYTRIGTNSIVFDDSGDGRFRFTGISTDFAPYSGADLFAFAMIGTGDDPTTVEIRFNTDDANYYSYTVSVASLLGASGEYKTSSFAKSNWGAVGTPNWSDITSLEFVMTGSDYALQLDGVRVEDADTVNPDYDLVSRTILDDPIYKSAGRQMDVEYYLDLVL